MVNVDDDGNELGSGVMELTDSELVLHTHRRDDVRWPYLCLRRYGYDSNLFSFESGRRCQTGQGENTHTHIHTKQKNTPWIMYKSLVSYWMIQLSVTSLLFSLCACVCFAGIFAFKCSRAEEIFNMLQEVMHSHSISVVEEAVMEPSQQGAQTSAGI